MPVINQQRVTVVLKPRPGETLNPALSFLMLGSTVQIGRTGAVVASVGEGDQLEELELLQSQVILAESAMRRGVVLHDQDHLPALTRVLSHIPKMYLEVADIIRQEAINDGSDPAEADEAAGQAIRVLVTFKQRLERMLGPDLLSTGTANYRDSGSLNTENPVVAETPYCEVRATNIDEWIRTVQNAKRYEFLRDRRRVQDMDTDLCAAREEKCFFGAELDTEIDNGIRLARLEEMHSCAD